MIDLDKLKEKLGPGFLNLAVKVVGPDDPGKLHAGEWVTGEWSMNLNFSLRVDEGMSPTTAAAFLHEQFRSKVWSHPKLERLLANTAVDYLDVLRYANHVSIADKAVLHDLVNAIISGDIAKARHAVRKKDVHNDNAPQASPNA